MTRRGLGVCVQIFHFNSHAHVERDHVNPSERVNLFNFNSHAHVERDRMREMNITHQGISTHTLTWSVTQATGGVILVTDISTHTLTWSVTISEWIRFQGVFISTHTLTWSVTDSREQKWGHIEISTHTLTWSVTAMKARTNIVKQFQLTRSRGA